MSLNSKMLQDINKRLLVEKGFLESLLTTYKFQAPQILVKLSKINSLSQKYPLKNNIISDSCFIYIIRTKKLIRGEGLLGAISPENIEQKYNGSNNNTKIIKRAIDLASSYPWNVAILTNTETKQKFLSNSHYNSDEGIKESIQILDFDESLKLIDELNNIITCTKKTTF